ncbi:Brevican core protein [Exaiptasia diaphana]|nr:Brevican core protein [Exaiptasia diaphana]
MCQILKGDQHVTPVEQGTCLPGFEKLFFFCYLFKFMDKQPWSSARYRCMKLGGDLVSILNFFLKDFLVYRFKDLSWKFFLWTGLNDRSYERGYEWTDGSPVAFTAWATKQPNDNQGTENCVSMWSGTGLWSDRPCTWKLGYICKAKLECSSPLGMASGNITKDQINASSSLDILHTPDMGRMNGSSGWCASDKDKAPYFQVEFLDEMEIAKIGIKGVNLYNTPAFIKSFTVSYAVYKDQWMPYHFFWANRASDKNPWLQVTWPGFAKRLTKIGTWGAGPGKNAYVTRYKLAFFFFGQVFTDYQEKGVSRIFRGNIDSTKQIVHVLSDPIKTQYFRIIPLSGARGGICLRFELYGCASE